MPNFKINSARISMCSNVDISFIRKVYDVLIHFDGKQILTLHTNTIAKGDIVNFSLERDDIVHLLKVFYGPLQKVLKCMELMESLFKFLMCLYIKCRNV